MSCSPRKEQKNGLILTFPRERGRDERLEAKMKRYLCLDPQKNLTNYMHKSAFIKINWEVYIFIMKFDWQNSEGQEI